MNSELKLSDKSREFLDHLRLYLFSSGKHSDEIEEIVEELEVHLSEAEKNGKPIEKIIGKSPKEYMEMVSNEMAVDYRSWIKSINLIVFGSFSFTIFSDLMKGNLSYSVLEIVGHLFIGAVFLAAIATGFKYISATNLSIKKQGLLVTAIMILPIALFVGLIYANRAIDTPVIHFGSTASLIIGGITAFFIIGASFWAKTWIFLIVVALLTLPDFLLGLTPLTHDAQLMISPWITFGGIGLYRWLSLSWSRKNGNK